MTHPATQPSPSFAGFEFPQQNWFKMPKTWTDLTADMSSIAEMKIVEYVLKHTWGYQEYGVKKAITIDEFRHGRKRQDGRRLDKGTGLAKQSVITGIKSAVKRGLLEEEVDDRDKARIKKYYYLRMKKPGPSQASGGRVKKLDADVQNLDIGVQDLDSKGQTSGHRTEKETKERYQQQEHPERSPTTNERRNRDLAAVLVDKGIVKRVAYQFATKFDRRRIENNIDWFEWKLENEPNSIKTNPAGLLRRAIEQDYASEGFHKGFRTRTQKAAIAAAKKQRLATQQSHVAALERRQQASHQQKELQRAKRLEIMRERYQTTTKEQSSWSQVLKTLKQQMTETQFNLHLAQSVLLSLKNDNALIAVPNRFIKTWMEDHLSKIIQRTLAQQLKGKLVAIHYLVLDGFENEYKKSATGPP